MKAHQLDMGGVVPGGFSIAKRNVYENGLVLSPRALYRAGKPVHETWSLIFDNVRFGEILVAGHAVDRRRARPRRAAARARRSSATASPAVHGAMRYACDAAAERMSTALAAIPDGTWVGEDLIDCDAAGDDEEYRVRVTVTKRGGRAEVDFSGTSRQARTCINATPLDAKTTVGIAFKYLFDPEGWFTSGAMRCVDLVIPEGTVVSALPPDGAVFAYWEQSQVMLSARAARARAGASARRAIAGDRGSADIHSANGVRPDGSPWISAAQVGGEIGAVRRQPARRRRQPDALLPGERDRRRRRVGRVRGAGRRPPARDRARHRRRRATTAAARRCCATRSGSQPAEHHLMSLRYKRAPGFGVHGGGDGATGGIWIDRDEARRGDRTSPASDRTASTAYPYRVPFWETRAGRACSATSPPAAAAGATRSSASPSASCATSATGT